MMGITRIAGAMALAAGLLAAPLAAQAAVLSFGVTLSGPAEDPPNASPGTGTGTIVLDTTAHTLSVDVTFSGLTAPTTAAHIHCCTATPFSGIAGVATQVPTFAGFPLGVTGGTYSHVFDTTLAATWNPAFVTANGGTPLGAEAALAAGLLAGRAYLNIHTEAFPRGEIRGFAVPEPAALALFGLGLASLGAAARKRAGT